MRLNGTAYGEVRSDDIASVEELAVIPAGGEPELSSAPVPAGILNGGLAIHSHGSRGEGTAFQGFHGEVHPVITANPITSSYRE